MTQEKPRTKAEFFRIAQRAFEERALTVGLSVIERIDLRNLRVLQDMGLLKSGTESALEDLDGEVVVNPSHPLRESLPPGPVVIFSTKGVERKRFVVELHLLLLSESQELRGHAVSALQDLLSNNTQVATPKTVEVFSQNKEAILAAEPSSWIHSSVAVFDAFCDDFLIALSAIQQALSTEPAPRSILDYYAPRILYPSVSSLDSQRLSVDDPEKQRDRISAAIKEAKSASKTIADVCTSYYREIGYLPLAPAFGLAEAVRLFLEDNPGIDVWGQVWDWAYGQRGPLPIFHSCALFAVRPDLVPEGSLPSLWERILQIAEQPSAKDQAETKGLGWPLLQSLARHYMHHLEAALPSASSSVVWCYAWWLAYKVSEVFPDDGPSVRYYLNKWVKPAADISAHIWTTASVGATTSVGRYLTLVHPSPWAAAILCIVGDKIEQLRLSEQPDEVRNRLYDAVILQIVSSLPFGARPDLDPIYAFQLSMLQTAVAASRDRSETDATALSQLLDSSNLLSTNPGLCGALRSFAGSSLADQVAVSIALKARAYVDNQIGGDVLSLISQRDWRIATLGAVDARILGNLMTAFDLLQKQDTAKWTVQLPHYLAELFEGCDDAERRKQLFFYTVHASMSISCFSAVRRLMTGERKAELSVIADEFREQLIRIMARYPPGVVAKVRSLLSNLRTV
jgi:hypothetical protein